MIKYTFQLLLFIAMFMTSLNVFGQASTTLNAQKTGRPITTAVPFVSFAPDGRASGMGDVGVATSPDANSVHWNNGKLAFIDSKFGASISYSPWLGKLLNDMSLNYVSGYYKIDRVQTIGVSMRYFDMGQIQLTNSENLSLGVEHPREYAFDGTYSRKLSENLGIGVSARYITSNLVGSTSGTGKAASSVAVDLGLYYTKEIMIKGKNADFSLGASITNIGQKVTYAGEAQADFIPTNLRVGTALKLYLDPYNSITLAVDLNKLMVPTPPIYQVDDNGEYVLDNNGKRIIDKGKDPNRNLISGMFGSFNDAPNGMSEELKEVMIASGMEYWYKDLFSARVGYFYETQAKGGRQYLTAGIGLRYQKFGVDFSYLYPPNNQNHPLAETIRFSLIFRFDKEANTEDLN